MTIWELEKVAYNLNKTVFGDDKDKYMLCPNCDEPSSSFWGGMKCENNHFYNCDDFLSAYLKKHFSLNGISRDDYLYIFQHSVKDDMSIKDLKCFHCSSPLKFKQNHLTCDNGHDISCKDYLANYLDMLDGFLDVSCNYLKDDVVK